jgi:muramoyltetrapeptide carboxypeptidase
MKVKVGVLASGFVVPQFELSEGIKKLRTQAGFDVRVHPQVKKKSLFFAGNDEERLQAWEDFAWSSEISVLWCARGGHGALRLLPRLADLTRRRGKPPRKLLIGYSDSTLFHEFVRREWGWATLHAPMTGGRELVQMDDLLFARLQSWVRGESGVSIGKSGLSIRPLNALAQEMKAPCMGEVVGGNLTVLTCLLGTPWSPQWSGKILFLEDVGEMWFRVDRMLAHLSACGAMKGVRAVVLGTFSGCRDATTQVLKPRAKGKKPYSDEAWKNPQPADLEDLRTVIPNAKAFRDIFEHWGEQWGIPIFHGLNVGHGGGLEPLPLGAKARISGGGSGRKFCLEIMSWDWKLPRI